MSTGRLTVVGLGPGDPELVTIKAARALASARTIVFFAARATHLRDRVDEIRLEYPVTTEIPVRDPEYRRRIDAFHDAAAARLAARLGAGEDLALLCEGDPFFYGSSMHLHDRLRERFPCTVIPGITAMSGAWSDAGQPIAHGDDVFAVVPGTLSDARLAATFGGAEAHVVMKLGRNLKRVRAALADAGRLDDALYVEHATSPEARVVALASRAPDAPAPYFSLLLVPGRKAPR